MNFFPTLREFSFSIENIIDNDLKILSFSFNYQDGSSWFSLLHLMSMNPIFFSFTLKMLEIGARMEMKAKAQELMESTDTECSDITFEELLAQEKKDSFWFVINCLWLI